jgi:hypothetical protein
MAKLKEVLLKDGKRDVVVTDCVRLVDDEVANKGGLSGIAVKGAYAIVKAIKPGIIREAVDRMLDEFVDKLDGYYADYESKGSPGTFESFLSPKAAAVADTLLGVTDRRAAKAENATIKKAYEKLRPTGAKHVEAAVPGIARVVQRHV